MPTSAKSVESVTRCPKTTKNFPKVSKKLKGCLKKKGNVGIKRCQKVSAGEKKFQKKVQKVQQKYSKSAIACGEG